MSETIIYSKASVERRSEYRQLTLILSDGDKRWVRKAPVGRDSANHIKRYTENLERLNATLKPQNTVEMIPCRQNADGSVDFPFLTDPTLGALLSGKSPEDYLAAVRTFEAALISSFETCHFEAGEDFVQFFGVVPAAEGKTALRVANADLNFDNVFCGADGRYTIIDYEWVLPFPLPLSFLTYRSLMLDPAYGAFSDAQKRFVADGLGIDEALSAQYHQMELAFLAHISPDEYKLDYFARVSGARENMVFSVDIKEIPRLTRDLSREVETAKRLYDELERERETIHPKYVLKGLFKKNRVLTRCWKGMAYLYHYGPAATLRRIRGRIDSKIAEKRFMKALIGPSAEDARKQYKSVPETIKFSVVVPLYNTPEDLLREMIQSVRDQFYSNWELCLADGSDSAHGNVGEICAALAAEDGRIVYKKLPSNGGISENTNRCLEMATGDYIALLDHDDLLHPSALSENARAICEQGADFLYSDEVVFATPDRYNLIATHFKPDFSPESLYSNNYICHLSVFRRALLEQAGAFRKEYDGSQDFDIILRLTDCAQKVVHIPKVLYFWRSHPTSVASDISTKTYAIDAGKNAIRDFFLKRRGFELTVESVPEYPTMYHLWLPVDRRESVNVLLDWIGKDRSDMMENLAKLCAHTLYVNASFTVISDADPSDDEQARFPRVKWLTSSQADRAGRLNEAVQVTQGAYLVFLDAGLACEKDDWIEQMLMFAREDGIGAVGGKIYCTDRTLRHAGLILGFGSKRLVGRSHFGTEQGNSGYFGQLAIAGNVSAVSLECMMIKRERFEALGGFDAGYGDALFDADMCLRLRQSGLRNVYTPFALFTGGDSGRFSLNYGVESAGYARASERFKQRWAEAIEAGDPCYNANLTLDYPDYRIKA